MEPGTQSADGAVLSHFDIDGQFPFHIYGAQQDEGSIEGPSATNQGGDPAGDLANRCVWREHVRRAATRETRTSRTAAAISASSSAMTCAPATYRSVSPWPNYLEGATSAAAQVPLRVDAPDAVLPIESARIARRRAIRAEQHRSRPHVARILSPDLTRNDPATEGPTGGPIELDQTSAEVYPYVSALAASRRSIAICCGPDRPTGWCM